MGIVVHLPVAELALYTKAWNFVQNSKLKSKLIKVFDESPDVSITPAQTGKAIEQIAKGIGEDPEDISEMLYKAFVAIKSDNTQRAMMNYDQAPDVYLDVVHVAQ